MKKKKKMQKILIILLFWIKPNENKTFNFILYPREVSSQPIGIPLTNNSAYEITNEAIKPKRAERIVQY